MFLEDSQLRCSPNDKGALTKIAFSGHPNSASTQISKIEGCELKRQSGSLPFLFKNGACGTYSNKVFLCFGESSKSQCQR